MQMETGQDWLLKTFPFLEGRIQVLWQIDPFGSSPNTPLLFGANPLSEIHYKYAVLNRIGDTYKDEMKEKRSREFFWRHELQDKEDPGLMTHVLYTHYETQNYHFLRKNLYPQPPFNYLDFTYDFYHDILEELLSS